MNALPYSRLPVPLRWLAALLLASLALLAPGCCLFRRPPPPPPLPAEKVIEAVRAQSEAFHTLKDTDISLVVTTTADGKAERSPTLGGVIAFNADLPGLWLYTQKVTRAVFTLSALRDRFWLALEKTCELVVGSAAAYDKLPHLVRPEEVQGFFAGPDWLGLTWPSTTMSVEPEDYRFDVYLDGSLRRQVFVDRRKVAISRIRRYDALGQAVTDIYLQDHEKADGGVFPHRLIVRRPLNGVEVELELDDPKLNVDLPPEMFVPPERPGWKVINLDYEPLSAVEAFRAEE